MTVFRSVDFSGLFRLGGARADHTVGFTSLRNVAVPGVFGLASSVSYRAAVPDNVGGGLDL